MADEIKNEKINEVEAELNRVDELLKNDRKEQETMTTGEKIGAWFERNGENLIAGSMILGVIGLTIGGCIATAKEERKREEAKIAREAEDRRLAEKWMDTQLECAKIEADAYVRKQTATTGDIAEIVKTVAKN
jgi:hypothetical protein